MEPTSFLDTNVKLHYLLGDHPTRFPASTSLFEQIAATMLAVRCSDMVIFETVFTLEKYYNVPRIEIQNVLQPLLDLPGLILPGKRMYSEVMDV